MFPRELGLHGSLITHSIQASDVYHSLIIYFNDPSLGALSQGHIMYDFQRPWALLPLWAPSSLKNVFKIMFPGCFGIKTNINFDPKSSRFLILKEIQTFSWAAKSIVSTRH